MKYWILRFDGVIAAVLTGCVVFVLLASSGYGINPESTRQELFLLSIVPTPVPAVMLEDSCNAWKAAGDDLAMFPVASEFSGVPLNINELAKTARATLGNIAILERADNFLKVHVSFNSANEILPEVEGYVNQTSILPWGVLNPHCREIGIGWEGQGWVAVKHS